jgi:PIN domain nuclease of toxin-antitoxin system
MKLVFDACSRIAVIKHEANYETVLDLLESENIECHVHGSNLCEVYYDVARDSGEKRAEQIVDYVLDMGLQLSENMDRAFWQEAGQHKARYRRISLADCFCLTLARQIRAEIVTCDREFNAAAADGVCNVRFFR